MSSDADFTDEQKAIIETISLYMLNNIIIDSKTGKDGRKIGWTVLRKRKRTRSEGVRDEMGKRIKQRSNCESIGYIRKMDAKRGRGPSPEQY